MTKVRRSDGSYTGPQDVQNEKNDQEIESPKEPGRAAPGEAVTADTIDSTADLSYAEDMKSKIFEQLGLREPADSQGRHTAVTEPVTTYGSPLESEDEPEIKNEILKQLGIDPGQVQTVADRGHVATDALRQLTPHDLGREMSSVRHDLQNLPKWPEPFRQLFVRNTMGLEATPELGVANQHPMVRAFDDHNELASFYLNQAQAAFEASRTSLEEGRPQEALERYQIGLEMQKVARGHIDRNLQWNNLRMQHNMGALKTCMDSYWDQAMFTVGGGMALSMFQIGYRAFSLGQTSSAFTKIFKDPELVAKMTPKALSEISKDGGRIGITVEEAEQLIYAAKLPGQIALKSAQSDALRMTVLTRLAGNTSQAANNLRKVLEDDRNLAGIKVKELEKMSRIGEGGVALISEEEARILKLGADLRRNQVLDQMNWPNALKSLVASGDRKGAQRLATGIRELQGHHAVVSSGGERISQLLPNLKKMAPEELMEEMNGPKFQRALTEDYLRNGQVKLASGAVRRMTPHEARLAAEETSKGLALTHDEAEALAAELKGMPDEVHFTYHDLLSRGGKTNTQVARGLALPGSKFSDPIVADRVDLHNIFNDHHHPLAPLSGLKDAGVYKSESAVDLIAAWRQDRVYKGAYSWQKIDDILMHPKADDALLKDPAMRGWLKLMRLQMYDMEKTGLELVRPEKMVPDFGKFVFNQGL